MQHNIYYEQFSYPILTWYEHYGRKNLPWQLPRTAYRVWLSEIMLQQTQVQTVIPYYNRFMAAFPDVHTLARAQEDEVLALWSGLGYYSRARNLHRTAYIISNEYQGNFPQNLEVLQTLPGIGPSTAAAIASQAFNLPTAILDGNVKRVLTRFFAISGWPERSDIKKKLWQLANACMPQHHCAEYTQAIMDLGALCCTSKKPKCSSCPVQASCEAHAKQEQLLYPNKKIKKAIPLQQQQFLVFMQRERPCLSGKTPTHGIVGWFMVFAEY